MTPQPPKTISRAFVQRSRSCTMGCTSVSACKQNSGLFVRLIVFCILEFLDLRAYVWGIRTSSRLALSDCYQRPIHRARCALSVQERFELCSSCVERYITNGLQQQQSFQPENAAARATCPSSLRPSERGTIPDFPPIAHFTMPLLGSADLKTVTGMHLIR